VFENGARSGEWHIAVGNNDNVANEIVNQRQIGNKRPRSHLYIHIVTFIQRRKEQEVMIDLLDSTSPETMDDPLYITRPMLLN
jgi:hypothetical protein